MKLNGLSSALPNYYLYYPIKDGFPGSLPEHWPGRKIPVNLNEAVKAARSINKGLILTDTMEVISRAPYDPGPTKIDITRGQPWPARQDNTAFDLNQWIKDNWPLLASVAGGILVLNLLASGRRQP